MATATRSAIQLTRPSLSIPRFDLVDLELDVDGCPCCAATRSYADVEVVCCAALASASKRVVTCTSATRNPKLCASSSTALPTPISPTVAEHCWPVPCPSADAGQSCSVSASACRPPSVLSQASQASQVSQPSPPSETTSTTYPGHDRRVSHQRALAYSPRSKHQLVDSDGAAPPVYKASIPGFSQQTMSASLHNNKATSAFYPVLLTPPTSPLERPATRLSPMLDSPQLPTPWTPSRSTSSSTRGIHYGVLSSSEQPPVRVKTPDIRPLDAIHGRDRSLSMLFTLPNETLSHILSFLPLSSLPPLMRVCSHLHALSERALYHTLQHIQIYSPPDLQADHSLRPASSSSSSKEWALIHTLSTRASAARSVRHFAVRGLPCFGQDGVGLLARALRGMQSGLVSLEINLGLAIERALVQTLSSMPSILPSTHGEPDGFVNLSALNVLDTQTALWFLSARHNTSSSTPIITQQHQVCTRGNDRLPSSVDWNGKDGGSDHAHGPKHAAMDDGGLQTPGAHRSPLSVLRIDFQHPLDAASLNTLLGALDPPSQPDDNSRLAQEVQQLQLGLQCRSADEASAMASTIARRLPTLRLLGLHVYPCSPEEQVLDFMATSYDVVARSLQSTATEEKQMEKTWDLSTCLNDALSRLPLLQTLSFAYSLPFTMGQTKVNAEALAYHSTRSTLHDHATPCGGSLNLIELQWSAWELVPPRASASSSVSQETKCDTVSREWTAIPASWHQFIRLGWAYASASFV